MNEVGPVNEVRVRGGSLKRPLVSCIPSLVRDKIFEAANGWSQKVDLGAIL